MIPVTPNTVKAAYEFLRHFPPFNRWSLPPSNKITFYVTDFIWEDPEYDAGKHTLRVSAVKLSKYHKLIEVMAHEMIHVREHVCGKWTKKHNSAFFLKCRRQICKHFDFDPLTF